MTKKKATATKQLRDFDRRLRTESPVEPFTPRPKLAPEVEEANKALADLKRAERLLENLEGTRKNIEDKLAEVVAEVSTAREDVNRKRKAAADAYGVAVFAAVDKSGLDRDDIVDLAATARAPSSKTMQIIVRGDDTGRAIMVSELRCFGRVEKLSDRSVATISVLDWARAKASLDDLAAPGYARKMAAVEWFDANPKPGTTQEVVGKALP